MRVQFQNRLIQPFILWLIAALVVLGFDYVWHENALKAQIERSLVAIERPVAVLIHLLGAPRRWLDYTENGLQRIADLEERLHLVVVERTEYERLQDEVIDLQAMLEAPVTAALPPIKLVTDMVTLGEERFITAGSTQEVEAGMMVTDEEGVLVGMVVDVGRYLSKVELVGAAGGDVGVMTHPRGTKGLLRVMRDSVQMAEVLQSEQLQVGDVVVTDGRGNYPVGVVLGQVVAIYSEPAEVTKSAAIELMGRQDGKVKVY